MLFLSIPPNTFLRNNIIDENFENDSTNNSSSGSDENNTTDIGNVGNDSDFDYSETRDNEE